MSSILGKYQIAINASSLADGDSIASYLVDSAGALITSTLIGAKQSIDALDASSHAEGSAFTAGDYGSFMLAIDESGNYEALNINAAGELLVNANVSFTAEHAEDSASADGDSLIGIAAVRQDTLATDTSADGDYSFVKVDALGELYVKDTDVLAELVLIKGDTAAIATSVANIDTTTSNIYTEVQGIHSDTTAIAASVSDIDSLVTALSKAEDSAHVSGDQGIQALAVRKDAQGSNVSADGDYASLLQWSEGSLKVVDIANGSILQQQVSVTSTAAAVPASALANRKSLMLQNSSAASIWIGSATVTSSGATTGIELPKASFMELEVGPAVDVYAVKSGAGSLTLNVLEMA
jgi:hypothetical protein